TSQESLSQRFLFGGLSCMAAACVTNPIDVIKTRLQLQGELAKKAASTTTAATLRTINQEGVRGLYKGLAPSLLREATYSTLRMGGYDMIKVYFVDKDGKTSLPSKIISGCISGGVGACIANPTDLIKVRMQAQSTVGGHRYTSMRQAFTDVIQKEGIRGLYKGVGPTTQRAALLTASQLASYDQFKHSLIDHGLVPGEGLQAHVSASLLAGFVAAVVTSPVDVIKTRIMNQPFDASGHGTMYRSTLDCLTKTLQTEGLHGLYKGFIPNWLRIGPHTLVTFIFYENLRKLGGISPV
ncbi:hypothetical protein SAMD00019534_104260, partial [Acytostelium subglobosum LB1]|uniref:hypothetical protein n=1 Tax=Acytostelium subglobosum LB1 TaxID=1410327 RepID=UPI000644B8C0